MSSPEERRDQLLQDTGARIALTLQALSRAVVLYESNNAIIVRLIDQMIEAVSAYATLGEITRVLSSVFGEFREPSLF